jgi:beta-glucosidase
MAQGATSFPQAIGLAATWEPELVTAMTDSIRQQMRAIGAHHALAPVIDINRDPRWGRIEETFGEDPYLVSRIGLAYIKGIQGYDWQNGVVATAKHFLGYGWSEGGMNWAPAHIPEREVREIFVTPFKAAIQEGNIGSIMNAYQELDGVPVGSSREIMVDLLREELGFNGVVVSDYYTLDMFIEYHHVAHDKAEAAVYGLEAGIDIELPAHDIYGDALRDALENGDIDISLVDISVKRILEMKVRLGLFEQPYVDADSAIELFMTPEQRDLSCEIAEKSIVLLKNDGLLPLPPDLESVAVIGPSADSVRLLQGNYHYPSHMEGILSGVEVNEEAPAPPIALPSVDLSVHFPPSVTVLKGIQQSVGPDTTVHYEKGCEINTDDTSGIRAAIEAAEKAHVAIVVVGGKSGLNTECTTGESIDRATLGLPGVQQQLVEAVVATGTPTVVVLINGRPLSIPWIDEHVPAVVEAWLPAQEGGRAIANVLFGRTNPGGKLPVSVPRHVGQVPVYYNHKPSGGRTHWQGDYIDSPTSPLYPFGHGLSYTDFEYSALTISPTEVCAHETVDVSCTVTNTGSMFGDEVVQFYVRDVIASVTRPVKELKGFKRISLAPGESVQITFQLPVNHMAFYDRSMNFVVEPGEIEVMLGSSSADIRLRGQFEISGETTEVDQVFTTPVEIHR